MDTPVLHIQLDENGIPRTINRNVKVKMIARQHIEGGLTIPEIAEHYGITLADVHSALAYYYDNKAQMDAERKESEALLKDIGIAHADLKAKILGRMADKQNLDGS